MQFKHGTTKDKKHQFKSKSLALKIYTTAFLIVNFCIICFIHCQWSNFSL